jgi:O-antigen/teichoic acid export membrane protein
MSVSFSVPAALADAMRRHGRFAVAVADQALLSLFNFGSALWLLRLLEPSAFGLFTIVMALSHAAVAVQEALTSTPLGVRYAAATPAYRRHLLGVLGAATGLYGVALLIPIAALLTALSGDPGVGLAAALFVAGFTLRSYIRSAFYAMRREGAAMALDAPFLILSVVVMAWIQLNGPPRLDLILLALTLANLIPLAAAALADRRPFARPTFAAWKRYRLYWPEVRWSLVGVAAVLTQRQSHTAVVPALMSPAAYATLAAADAIWGPARLAVMAVGMVLRPELGRLAAEGRRKRIDRLVGGVQLVLTAMMAALCTAVFLAWPWIERVAFAGKYPDIAVPMALAGAITVVQVWRLGPSVALQALHRFRDLGRLTVFSAAVSLAATLAAAILFGWLWALAGVLAGEALNLILLSLLLRRAPVPKTIRFPVPEDSHADHLHAPHGSR